MTKLKKTKIIEQGIVDEEVMDLLPPKDHNKRARPGGVAVDQLKGIISRIEKLEEEKSAIADDIKDVFAEAKGNGFDVKAIKKIIRLRKISAQEREEEENVLHVYMHALGMLPDLEYEDGKED